MAYAAAVLNVVVTVTTGKANASLAGLQTQLNATATAAERSAARTQAAYTKGAKVGALALAGLGAYSIKAASDFESSFAEVRKTVDTTNEGFDKIESGIRGMAKTIPVGTDELNNIAGAAGALGVKANNIVKFTRVAADLGVTTNLTSDAAATSLARLANIMDTKGKRSFQRMGSTLVDLGNKGASTEDEIASLALRISGAGQTVGLSEKQVFGFAAALANVGIAAEAGGTAISKVMLNMQGAIASGGSELRAFAETASMSVGEFTKLFKRNAPEAIQAYVQGLDKINDSGGDIRKSLEAVGMNDIRVRDMLLRLGGAGDEIAETQKIASSAWRENTALTAEAEKRYATTSAQFQILKNRLKDVAISIGQVLLPVVNKLMGAFSNFAASGAFKPVLAGIAALTTALIGLKVVTVVMRWWEKFKAVMYVVADSTLVLRARLLALTIVEKVSSAMAMLGNTALVVRARLLAMAAVERVVMAFNALKAAVVGFSLTARTAMMATGIGALIVGATLIVTHWKEVRKFLEPVWDWIKQAGADIWKEIGPTMTKVGNWLAEAGTKVAAVAVQIGQALAAAWRVVGPILTKIGELILKAFIWRFKATYAVIKFVFSYLVAATRDVVEAMIQAWNFLKPVIVPVAKAVFGTVKSIVVTAVRATVSFVKGAVKVLGAVWKGLKAVLVPVVKAAWAVVKAVFKAGVAFVKTYVKTGVTVLKAAWSVVKAVLVNPIKAAFSFIRDLIRGIWKGPIGDAIRFAVEKIGDGFGAVVDKVKSVFNSVKDVISGAVGVIRDVVVWLIDNVINRIPGVEIDTSGISASTAPSGKTSKMGKGEKGAYRKAVKDGKVGLARGGHITGPMVMVGEEAPQYPEIVLATNPAYRNRNLGLWMQAGRALGVPGFGIGGAIGGALSAGLDVATGGVAGKAAKGALDKGKELIENLVEGVDSRVGDLPSWMSGLPSYIKDQGIAYIKDKIPGLAKGGVIGKLPGKGKGKGKGGKEAGAEAGLTLARSGGTAAVVELAAAEQERTAKTGDRIKAIKSEEATTLKWGASSVRASRQVQGAEAKLTSASGVLTQTQKKLATQARQTAGDVGGKLTRSLRQGRDEAATFGRRVQGSTSTLRQRVSNDMKRTRDSVVTNMTTATDKGIRKARSLASGVGGSVTGLSVTVAQGLSKIASDMNSVLGALGAKKVSWGISSAKGKDSVAQMQTGGALVPGVGAGDKVPLHMAGKLVAMVEPNELVTVNNRESTKRLLAHNKEFPRRGVQRLAGGGSVLNRPFNVDGAQPGFVPFMNFLNGMFGPIYVMSGNRPGSIVAGSGGLSNHSGGHAVDISTKGIEGATSDATLNATGPLAKRMDALYAYMARNIPTSKVSGDFLWRTNTGGNHFNHIHRGITNGMETDPAKMIAFLSTLPGGGFATVKRVLLDGPKGPLRDLGQAALDTAWRGAKDFINDKAMEPNFPGGPIQDIPHTADLPPKLRKWNRRFPGAMFPSSAWYDLPAMPFNVGAALAEWAGMPGVTFAQVSKGEGALKPGSMGDDNGDGNPDGYGWLAITRPYGDSYGVSKFGGYEGMLNPVANAIIAGRMYASQGPGAWYGTKYVTDWNAHYTGPLLRAEGGQVAGPLLKPTTGGFAPITPTPFDPASPLGEEEPPGSIWPDLGKTIDAILKARDTKKQTADAARKTLTGNLLAKYEKLKSRGLLFGSDGELGGRLAKLVERATLYGDYADKAATAAEYGGTWRAGAEPDLEGGPARGPANGTEAYWVTKQLAAWHSFREGLVDLEKEVQARLKKAAKVAKRLASKQKSWEKRLAQTTAALGVEGKTPKDWKGIDPATADLAKWNELSEKKRLAIADDFYKAGGVLPGTRKLTSSGKLIDQDTKPEAFPDVKPMEAVVAMLKSATNKLTGSDGLTASLEGNLATLASNFNDVQGVGGHHRHIRSLPDLTSKEALGGYIYESQQRLRELSKAQGESGSENNEALVALLQEQLAASRRETALLRLQMPVFSTLPYMGAFAEGGVALVGERGPELAAFPSGTRITSAAETRNMVAPEVSVVLNNCNIDTNGQLLEDAIRVEVNGQLAEAVRVSNRRLPSRV